MSESDEVTLTALHANPRLEARVYNANNDSVTRAVAHMSRVYQTGEMPGTAGM